MKTRLILILFIAAAVMAASTSLIDAEANDTYNFYFQKAPGPVTVNQGTSGQTANPEKAPDAAAVVNTVVPPAGAQPVQSVAATGAEDEPASAKRAFEFSVGYASSRFNGGSSTDDFGRPLLNRRDSEMINGNHYALGLQWNPSDVVGIQAEAFYMTKLEALNSKGTLMKSKGSPWDFAGGLVITPLRVQLVRGIKLNISGMVGGISVPFHKSEHDHWIKKEDAVPATGHAGSLYYGARLGLELSNRVAFNATVRKITRYDSTHGTASMAYLF